jgi:hypothetical protein
MAVPQTPSPQRWAGPMWFSLYSELQREAHAFFGTPIRLNQLIQGTVISNPAVVGAQHSLPAAGRLCPKRPDLSDGQDQCGFLFTLSYEGKRVPLSVAT